MTRDECINLLTAENDIQNNPHHCYDILHHSIQTVLFLMNEYYYEMDTENLSDILVAGYLHDIGKKRSKGINPKTGFDTFYNHAKISLVVIEEYNLKISELSKWLILHHDDRMFNKRPDCDEKTYIMLGQLMRADLEAQHPTFQKEKKIKELDDWYKIYKPS